MPIVELPVRAQTRRRVRNRLPWVIVVWIACVLGVGWVASATTVGPVVAELTPRRGFHVGDLVLAAGVAILAGLVSWFLLRPPPQPQRDGDPDIEVVVLELRRLPVILVLWFGVMVSSLWAAFETEVGPVLFVYNDHRSVRLGDLAFSVVAIAFAAWATTVLLRPSDRDPADHA